MGEIDRLPHTAVEWYKSSKQNRIKKNKKKKQHYNDTDTKILYRLTDFQDNKTFDNSRVLVICFHLKKKFEMAARKT